MVLCARHTPPCGEVKICWNRIHKSIGEIENVRMRTSFFFFFEWNKTISDSRD